MSHQNYNKMYVKSETEVVVPPVIEETIPPVDNSIRTHKHKAIVVNCGKLNIRTNPSPRASVICAIDATTEVIVFPDDSTDAYYKICTASGIEGFCMKDYLRLT